MINETWLHRWKQCWRGSYLRQKSFTSSTKCSMFNINVLFKSIRNFKLQHFNYKRLRIMFHAFRWGTASSPQARLDRLLRTTHARLSHSVHSSFRNRCARWISSMQTQPLYVNCLHQAQEKDLVGWFIANSSTTPLNCLRWFGSVTSQRAITFPHSRRHFLYYDCSTPSGCWCNQQSGRLTLNYVLHIQQISLLCTTYL